MRILAPLFALCLSVSVVTPAWADRIFTSGGEENNVTATVWDVNNGALFSTGTVHSGAYSVRFNAAATAPYVQRNLAAAVTSGTYFTRFYIDGGTLPPIDNVFLRIRSSASNDGVRIEYVQATSNIKLVNVVTTTTQTGSATLATGTWYRVELKHVLDNSAGSLELKLFAGESTTALDTLNITGEDTIPSANIQFWRFGVLTSTTCEMFMDDFAINDAVGSSPFNTYPGPGKISRLTVASDSAMQWEDETAGASVYSNIDDAPGTPDDADYNFEDDTLNQVDRINVGTLHAEVPSDADIIGVALYARIGSNQTADAHLRLKLWDEGGTLTDGPTANANVNGWKILTTAEYLFYAAGSKTKANVEAFDFGYENITDDTTLPRRVSLIWANVEWTEAAGGVKISGGGQISGAGTMQFNTIYFQDGFESNDFSAWSSTNVSVCGDAGSSTLTVQSGTKYTGTYAADAHYEIGTAECAAHEDANVWMRKTFAGNGYGHWFTRGRVRFKLNAGGTEAMQRKLVWAQDTAQDWSFATGTEVAAQRFRFATNGGCTATPFSSTSGTLPTYTWDTWYSVETEIQLNTPGSSDGVVRVWIDGTLAYENTSANLRGTCTTGLQDIRFGFQADRFNSDQVNTDRFWDDIVVASGYIGP